jgi:hypothetical protein
MISPRQRSILATLCDAAALGWSAYVALTFAWPACSFAAVPIWYVLANRHKRWTIRDRDRVIACQADHIKRLGDQNRWLSWRRSKNGRRAER